MAFLAAMPAWVGVATTAAAGVYSAAQSRKAGALQSNEIKSQQRVEKLSARQREIDRRKDLMRALASTNAAAAAQGAEVSGAIQAGVRRDINENLNDLLIDSAGTSARQSALSSQAANARRMGNARAVTTLLDTVGDVYKGLK